MHFASTAARNFLLVKMKGTSVVGQAEKMFVYLLVCWSTDVCELPKNHALVLECVEKVENDASLAPLKLGRLTLV